MTAQFFANGPDDLTKDPEVIKRIAEADGITDPDKRKAAWQKVLAPHRRRKPIGCRCSPTPSTTPSPRTSISRRPRTRSRSSSRRNGSEGPPSPRLRGEGRGEGQRHTPASEQASAPHPSPLPMNGEREYARRTEHARLHGQTSRHRAAGGADRLADHLLDDLCLGRPGDCHRRRRCARPGHRGDPQVLRLRPADHRAVPHVGCSARCRATSAAPIRCASRSPT